MKQIKIIWIYQQSTSGPEYGIPFTISGDAYKGLPQKVLSRRLLSNTFDRPKSAICQSKKIFSFTLKLNKPFD